MAEKIIDLQQRVIEQYQNAHRGGQLEGAKRRALQAGGQDLLDKATQARFGYFPQKKERTPDPEVA